MRKLPIYFLLDVSGSMRGEPIKAVNEGLRQLANSLRIDPYALETAFISVIQFNNTVEQIVPLTELYRFQPPELVAQLGTYIGKALRFLQSRAQEEVTKTTNECKGDWKPIVFIMSDGRSGDKISKALKEFDKNAFGNILICALGKDANIEALKEISETIVQLEEIDETSIKQWFKWVSASVSVASTQVENGREKLNIMDELPPIPEGINLI